MKKEREEKKTNSYKNNKTRKKKIDIISWSNEREAGQKQNKNDYTYI